MHETIATSDLLISFQSKHTNMFSTVVDKIVKQELENEARELETKIAEMKVNLQRASEPLHTNWDNYQDVEELGSNIESAKDQLSKLKGRIGRLDNDSLKTCSHRYACQCSGDKRAEREVVAMGTSKRLEEMKSFKEQGNTFFGEKKYREALDLYEKSLIYFEYCFDGTADEQAKADELRLSCLLNAGGCPHCTVFICRYQSYLYLTICNNSCLFPPSGHAPTLH